MREIKFEDVKPGDVARSNGKELKVVKNRVDGLGIRLEDTNYWLDRLTADALGVSFWREDRRLPGYPGAWVWANSVGHAVRVLTYEEDAQPWLTTDPDRRWKSDEELLEWLGPDWVEESTPPVRWVPVLPVDIEVGDYVRAETDDDGSAREGEVTDVDYGGMSIEIKGMGHYTVRFYTWFKREEQDNASE